MVSSGEAPGLTLPHACLRAEMNDAIDLLACRDLIQRMVIGEIDLGETEKIGSPLHRRDRGKAIALQPHRVVVVHIVDPEHPLAPRNQTPDDMRPDKAGRAGDEYGHE